MYEYRCTVTKVIDGDTVDCTVDLGFRVAIGMRFRLLGIDAPELRTADGKLAKARLLELMPEGSQLMVHSAKDRQEKYGRYLGTFYDAEGHNVNQRMIDEGHAVRFMD